MTLNIFYYEFLMAQSIARVDYKSLPSKKFFKIPSNSDFCRGASYHLTDS
jgi:hypothetical protein